MPYWRLSGFYLFYFAQLGIMLPYLSLYLKAKGFGVEDIGLLTAVIMTTKVVAPNLWVYIAGKCNNPLLVMRAGALLALLTFSGIYFVESFWGFAFVLCGFSFFLSGILPQLEVLTLGHLKSDANRYGRIRLWGSVGFILAATGLGFAFDQLSVLSLPIFLGLSVLAILMMSFSIGVAPVFETHRHIISLRHVLTRREVLVFLLVCCVMLISHGPYYTFYTLFLESLGYSKSLSGLLWGLGVAAEVGLFYYVHTLFDHVSEYWVLHVSVLLAALRWALIAWAPENLLILCIAQFLHAASYGSFHAASMKIVHDFFPGKLETHGQALYGSLSFGVGGALGALYAGYSWAHYGATMTFVVASIMCVIAAWLSYRFVALRPSEPVVEIRDS